MTPTPDDVRRQQALAGRSDLLDLLDQAVAQELDPARADMLAAAAMRIRAMNAEHDAVCTERGDAEKRASTFETALIDVGVDPAAVTAAAAAAAVDQPAGDLLVAASE